LRRRWHKPVSFLIVKLSNELVGTLRKGVKETNKFLCVLAPFSRKEASLISSRLTFFLVILIVATIVGSVHGTYDILPSSTSVKHTTPLTSGVRTRLMYSKRDLEMPTMMDMGMQKIYSTEDAFITDATPDTNYGSDPYLLVGKYDGGTYRTVLYFPLDSIPEGAKIKEAKLYLRAQSFTSLSGTMSIRAKRLPRGFTENCVTWRRRTCTQDWLHEGGDHVNPTASTTVSFSDCLLVSWDITDFVQGVVNGDYENYGLMLLSEDPFRANFMSREGAACPGENRPHIVVYYMKISLTDPSGGEELKAGETFTIKWLTSEPGGFVELYYSVDGGASYNLIDCAPNPSTSGSYDWTVPTEDSTNCKIKTVWKSSCGTPSEEYCTDVSAGTFKITTEYEIHLTAPRTGETITAGEIYRIRWETSTPGGKVEIRFSSDGGFSWTKIDCIDNTGGMMSYDWEVPEIESSQCLIEVKVIGNCFGRFIAIYDKDRASPFTIAIPEEPDFLIGITPGENSVETGKQASYTILITPMGGFSGTITLTVSGLPGDTTYQLNPAGAYTYSLVISTGETTGTFTFTVTASGGGKTHSDTATLIINPAPPPPASPTPSATPSPTPSSFNFVLSVKPPKVNVGPRGTISFKIEVELTSGTAETVHLSVEGLPSDFTWSFDQSSILPTGISTLNVKVGGTPGTYTFLIKGEGGGASSSATATIVISEHDKCVVATATYGSELSDEVQLLRGFRDNIVMRSFLGRSFMRAFNKFYYSWSPAVASAIEENKGLRAFMRAFLYPIIYTLRICQKLFEPLARANIEIGFLLMEVVSCAILGAIYMSPVLYMLRIIDERLKGHRSLRIALLGVISSLVLVPASYMLGSSVLAMAATSVLALSTLALGAAASTSWLGKLFSRL